MTDVESMSGGPTTLIAVSSNIMQGLVRVQHEGEIGSYCMPRDTRREAKQ